MQLLRPLESIESTYRPELFLSRELRPKSFTELATRVQELLLEHGTPAIVYVPEVKEAEKLMERLREVATIGEVETYHGNGARGQLPQSGNERSRVQQAFMDGTAKVVVATSAFGLGINKRGIRQVIHAGPSRDFLDGHVQEIGRAGRGQVPARCTLLASSSDLTAIDRSNPDLAETYRAYANTSGCR